MRNTFLVPELHDLLAANNIQAIRDFCLSMHPALVADSLGGLEPGEIWEILKYIPSRTRVEIFSHLDENLQIDMVGVLKREELANLISDMSPDDRVDLLKSIPEDKREALMPALAQAEREDIRRLSSYPEGTAGAIMTSEYVTLSPHLFPEEALAKLRLEAPDKETIYYAYVVDGRRKLIGFVSLKDLILAPSNKRIEEIMHQNVIFARVSDDQEDAARKIQKYDLLALPVINGSDALVGIITHDDAMDVITQEQTEDMEKLMAITGSHEVGAYLKMPAWTHFKNRSLWVIVLALLGLVSGFIVQSFEGLLMQFAILATFMPMLADTGGNTGSQSATLVIRALALREITPRDIFRILAKELQVSILLGTLLAVLAFARVFMFYHGSSMSQQHSLFIIGIAVAVALALQVISATLIGAFLPLAAAKLKFDPAVVASPALTTIVDITGLIIYFSIAKAVIGI